MADKLNDPDCEHQKDGQYECVLRDVLTVILIPESIHTIKMQRQKPQGNGTLRGIDDPKQSLLLLCTDVIDNASAQLSDCRIEVTLVVRPSRAKCLTSQLGNFKAVGYRLKPKPPNFCDFRNEGNAADCR